MIPKYITHSKATIGALLLFFLLNICLTSRTFANNSDEVGPEIIFQILASEIALISGNIPSALVTYLDVASKTGDVGAAKRATELALAIRDHESALKAAEIWQKSDSEDTGASDAVKALYLITGKNNKLIDKLIVERENSRKQNTLESFYNEVNALVSKSNNAASALHIFEKVSYKDRSRPEVMYSRAMLHYRKGDKDEMENILRSLVKKKPDHAQALNALGYSMADANKNLNEAFDLIKAALAFAPQDPHIIDSMGWIYFRLGQLEMAEEWLEKAFSRQPDAEISAHYGEVLWNLSREADAIQIWKMGFNKEPNNAILLETVDRLKVHIDKLKGNVQD